MACSACSGKKTSQAITKQNLQTIKVTTIAKPKPKQ